MAKRTKTEIEMESFFQKIGSNIRKEREKQGLTLEQAEEAGYPSWRHLQKVESGQPMTLKTVFNISKALGINPVNLFKNINLK